MQTTVEPVTPAQGVQRTGWVLAMVIGTTVLTYGQRLFILAGRSQCWIAAPTCGSR